MPKRKKTHTIDAHFAFALALHRVHALEDAYGAVISNSAVAKSIDGQDPSDVDIEALPHPATIPGLLLLVQRCMLHVCIEAWTRFRFTDAAVDSLLHNGEYRQTLRDARDRIFHPGLISEVIDAFPPSIVEFHDWSDALIKAMTDYSHRWFEANPNPESSSTGRDGS